MADENAKKCDHDICSCTASDDSAYCSAYCQAAGDSLELGCNCGHPGCHKDI